MTPKRWTQEGKSAWRARRTRRHSIEILGQQHAIINGRSIPCMAQRRYEERHNRGADSVRLKQHNTAHAGSNPQSPFPKSSFCLPVPCPSILYISFDLARTLTDSSSASPSPPPDPAAHSKATPQRRPRSLLSTSTAPQPKATPPLSSNSAATHRAQSVVR